MAWPAILTQWKADPSILLGAALAAVLYWRGWRPWAPRAAGSGRRGWQAAAFYSGLLLVVLALESPLDALGARLFAFHTIEHLVLIMVASPLLVLGDPGLTILRGVPLATRRTLLGAVAGRSWLHRATTWLLHTFRSPAVALALFLGTLYLWHVSLLFNLALRNTAVHAIEHGTFLVTAILFWGQLIDQRALSSRMSYVQRCVYTLVTAAASNGLALYFVFIPRPVYTGYTHLPTRLYGMSPLTDQQIAGAIMWVPVLFIFGGAFVICLYQALRDDEGEREVLATGTTPYSLVVPTADSLTRS